MNLRELDSFTLQSKAMVLWSPVFFLRNGSDTVATVTVGRNGFELSTGDQGALRIDRESSVGEPVAKLGKVEVRLSHAVWRICAADGNIGVIRADSSFTRLKWIAEASDKKPMVAEEQTSFFGRLLGSKWLKSFTISVSGHKIGVVRERFYPFGQKLSAQFENAQEPFDCRIAVALACVILARMSKSAAMPIS